jgi:hypothetical protein
MARCYGSFDCSLRVPTMCGITRSVRASASGGSGCHYRFVTRVCYGGHLALPIVVRPSGN